MTRDEFVTECRAAADATGSLRWTETTILLLGDEVFNSEWDELYAAVPFYRTATRTVTPDANGRVALADLDSGSGDSEQRFHKIVHVRKGTIIYAPGDLLEQPLAPADQDLATGSPRYWRDGDYIQLSPASAADSFEFAVRHAPVPPTELANGNSEIDYPAPMVLVYGVAGLMLHKGGQEPQEGRALLRIGEYLRDKLLLRLGRVTAAPQVWGFSDHPAAWAGQ